MVTVHYTGWTTDGKMFDSSVARRQAGHVPARSRHRRMDRGRAADGRRRNAPALDSRSLAYKGSSGDPKGMLVFDVELISFTRRRRRPPT